MYVCVLWLASYALWILREPCNYPFTAIALGDDGYNIVIRGKNLCQMLFRLFITAGWYSLEIKNSFADNDLP